MKMSQLDADLEIIRRVMNPTKEELLEERVARLYQECEELFVLAAHPETVRLFRGEWRELDQAATRLQWTATAIEASIPTKLKKVQNGKT